MFLAGDIGGTHTRMAFFQGDAGHLTPVAIEIFSSLQYSGLEAIVTAFLAMHEYPCTAACFGIAGPVREGRVQAPNLPWTVEADRLAAAVNLPLVHLINDLEANAHGIALLQTEDLVTLNEGSPIPGGNLGLISAGTGLGEAGLLFERGGSYRPFPSEGGHTDFAPRNPLEIALLEHLLQRFDHVSYERVLSGPGLVNIYRFLIETGRADEPEWLKDEIAAGDAASAVSGAALGGKAPACECALDLFCSIYGAEAGNLALKVMATGGMFVGGGIAPKILARLSGPGFLKAFTSKGRSSALLEAIPIRVITNDKTALLGAGRAAALFSNIRSAP